MTSKLIILLSMFKQLACIRPPMSASEYLGGRSPSDLELDAVSEGRPVSFLFWAEKPKDFIKLIDLSKVPYQYKGLQISKDSILKAIFKDYVENEVEVNERIEKLVQQNEDFRRYFPLFKQYVKVSESMYFIVYEKLQRSIGQIFNSNQFNWFHMTHRLQYYIEMIRAVHIFHTIGINHCNLSTDSFMHGSDTLLNSQVPHLKVVNFGRARLTKPCKFKADDAFSDELLKIDLAHSFSIEQEGEHFENSFHADLHSLATIILEYEAKVSSKIESFDVLTGIKLIRRYIKNCRDQEHGAILGELADLLLVMLGFSREAFSFEKVMYEMERIMYASSVQETIQVWQDYTSMGSWLKALKTALNKIGVEYNPEIHEVNPPDMVPEWIKKEIEEQEKLKLEPQVKLDGSSNQVHLRLSEKQPDILGNMIHDYFDFGREHPEHVSQEKIIDLAAYMDESKFISIDQERLV